MIFLYLESSLTSKKKSKRLPVVPRVLHPPSPPSSLLLLAALNSEFQRASGFVPSSPRLRPLPSSFCLLGRSPSHRRGASVFCLVFQVRRDLVDLVLKPPFMGAVIGENTRESADPHIIQWVILFLSVIVVICLEMHYMHTACMQ